VASITAVETGAYMSAAVSTGMEASRNAMPAMCERTRVMTAEMAVIDHRSTMRDIVVAAKSHAPAHEVRSPGVEAPAEAAKDSQADADAKADSESHHDAHRNRRHDKARISDHQRAEHDPRIVIRNGHQDRVDRRD
jgi:hypothetical protein